MYHWKILCSFECDHCLLSSAPSVLRLPPSCVAVQITWVQMKHLLYGFKWSLPFLSGYEGSRKIHLGQNLLIWRFGVIEQVERDWISTMKDLKGWCFECWPFINSLWWTCTASALEHFSGGNSTFINLFNKNQIFIFHSPADSLETRNLWRSNSMLIKRLIICRPYYNPMLLYFSTGCPCR